jgi:mono/diheme cytochrome c family protein
MAKWLIVSGAALALYTGGTATAARQSSASASGAVMPDTPQAVIIRSCTACHNDRTRSGNLSLESFDVATAGQHSEIAEKMIRKLRAGQMPPSGTGSRRPSDALLDELVNALER